MCCMPPVLIPCMILKIKGDIVEREVNFNILKKSSGNLMILVHARMGGVADTKVVYDGGQTAFLYRDKKDVVALDFIHPAIRADLKKKKEVLIVEVNGGSIIREYMTPVQAVKTMPVVA